MAAPEREEAKRKPRACSLACVDFSSPQRLACGTRDGRQEAGGTPMEPDKEDKGKTGKGGDWRRSAARRLRRRRSVTTAVSDVRMKNPPPPWRRSLCRTQEKARLLRRRNEEGIGVTYLRDCVTQDREQGFGGFFSKFAAFRAFGPQTKASPFDWAVKKLNQWVVVKS